MRMKTIFQAPYMLCLNIFSPFCYKKKGLKRILYNHYCNCGGEGLDDYDGGASI